jgi:hypothetical protein
VNTSVLKWDMLNVFCVNFRQHYSSSVGFHELYSSAVEFGRWTYFCSRMLFGEYFRCRAALSNIFLIRLCQKGFENRVLDHTSTINTCKISFAHTV